MKKESKSKVKKVEEYIQDHCNYCFQPFESMVDFGEKVVAVCSNPKCASYALFQIPMEKMPKENEEKRRKHMLKVNTAVKKINTTINEVKKCPQKK